MSIVDGFPLQQLTEAFGRLQFTTRGSCVSLEEIQRALLQPIMRGEWQHPFVALVKDSAPPDLSDYTIPNRNLVRELVPTAVVELMRQGYTLKVQNVELGLPSVRRVLNAVEASTGRYGSAVFFMTPHAETGLRPHRDDTDVVVEQIQGSKRWKVWAPTHEACDGLGVGAPTGKCHELLLQSGEFLYVPQGWMHCAQTESATPSIHVSYCLRPAAPQQVAASLRRAADPTTVTVDHVLRELTVTTLTPQEFLEAHVLSRPILIRDVSILRGSQSITGSFSRFLRVTGQPLLVVDQGRVRASWSTGRFSVRIPGDVTRAPRHAAPSNGIPETFVMSPACSVTVSLPRGADCMVGLVCGRAEVKVSYDSGTVTLDSSADGAVVVISWVEFGTREQDVALAEAAVSDHVGDLTALATSNLIDVIRTRQRLGS